jgi:hypothetical protein
MEREKEVDMEGEDSEEDYAVDEHSDLITPPKKNPKSGRMGENDGGNDFIERQSLYSLKRN